MAHLSATITFAAILLAGWSAGAWAAGAPEAATTDKDAFNLFNPTPDRLLRELTPDRPDKTESPYTVDAGHVQVEMDFANFTYHSMDRVITRSVSLPPPAVLPSISIRDEVHTRSWNVAPVNLKLGVLNNVDVQLMFENYLRVAVTDLATGRTTQSGAGDLTTRLKLNLWGNDGGQTAFAIMPFLKWPTSSGGLGNSSMEGGVIFPLAVELPAGFDLGLMTEADFQRDETGDGDHAAFINTITVGHDLVGKLGGYVEFFSEVSLESGSGWIGTVDLGLTYGLTRNIQLDAGVNLGVTRAADDVNVFSGLTVRF